MNTRTETQPFGDEYLDWKQWPDQRFGEFDARKASYFAAETGIRDGRGLRALELGFGNGSLLAWLASTGAEVYGVEANPRLVEQACSLLGSGFAFGDLNAAPLTRHSGQFTHVIAFDVLEHVPQEGLGLLLSQVATLLAPQGRLIARFPNGDSPFGRIHQHGDPTHVTTLGRSKLQWFAHRAGLEVECLRGPVLPPETTPLRALRRTLLLGARGLTERAVAMLYFGGDTVTLDPNYLAVLRKRRQA